MTECLACNGDIRPEEIPLVCTICKYSYHVGKCSGITGSAFRSKGDSFKNSWKCATCQTNEKRGGASSNLSESQRFESKLNQLNANILSLLPLVAKVDALSEAVKGISNIEASIQLLSDKYDEILEKSDSQGTEIAALRKRVERLESETSPNTQEVKAQLNELEQYSRRQNIEIHGMQKEENENLLDKMNCLARTLELPELSDSDLHSLHRLHPRAGKMPVVIARFQSVMLKEQWMQSRSRLREKAPGLRIFDNLTAMNKRLLWLAQTKGKEMKYRFVWQRNGHVFARKNSGDSVIRICQESDLANMV